MKPLFLNPNTLQKNTIDDSSPLDLVSKIIAHSCERSLEDSNLKSNKNNEFLSKLNIKKNNFFLLESEEVEIPLMESKINKNLYADYIVKLKRLTVRERFTFDKTFKKLIK